MRLAHRLTRRRRIALAAALALFWLILVGLLILPKPIPELAGRLVYVTASDRNTLNLLTLPSGAAQVIQRFDYPVGQPGWSPDGKRIVFLEQNPGVINGGRTADLYVINADGSGLFRLTHDLSPDVPRWSPDGRYVAFVSDSFATSSTAIFIVDMDSGSLQQLTQYATRDLDPQWSPDGSLIAFTTSRDGFQSIYSMTPQGTDFRQLAQIDQLNALQPDWSPDGRRIAYITQYSVGDGTAELHVMNADGSDQRQLTHDTMGEFEPDWSPDGQRIAYMGGANTSADIFVMDVDTGATQQLTHAGRTDAYTYPRWLPDGDHIVFDSDDKDGMAVRVMDVNGGSVRDFIDGVLSGNGFDWLGA